MPWRAAARGSEAGQMHRGRGARQAIRGSGRRPAGWENAVGRQAVPQSFPQSVPEPARAAPCSPPLDLRARSSASTLCWACGPPLPPACHVVPNWAETGRGP
jgi:hypothetical protein